MQARMKNPAMVLPGAMQAIQDLLGATEKGGVSQTTLGLVHLRASQINGCVLCVDQGTCGLQSVGEPESRLVAVAAWRQSDRFTDAERAALALSEAVTRLSDRADPVPDEIWEEAARHYDEPALAALVLSIATTNLFNRLNVTTRQFAAEWAS
ncbi:MAG TPA: carboxymuconolactone decarboxylase family protein [Dehalococcoidia bacterium]